MQPSRVLAALLLATLCAAPAAAQTLTLAQRLTNVFGNFLVGAGPVGDSGSFSEFLTAPLALSYSRDAADAGAVNGMFNGQPVVGSAGFASSARYDVLDTGISAGGSSTAQGSADYAYMSLGSNASSVVRLDFRVPVPTAFVLSGTILSVLGPGVNGADAGASAAVTFTGGGSWDTSSHQGSFESRGMLLAGPSYRLTGRSSATINGDASYSLQLVLTPIPEPAAWLLLGLGLPLVLLRRWHRAPPAPCARPGRAGS